MRAYLKEILPLILYAVGTLFFLAGTVITMIRIWKGQR